MKHLQFTVIISAFLMTAGLAAAGPHIVVDDPDIDLGSIIRGEAIDVVYEVRNTGDEPLEIIVRPACGCTVANVDSSIPAGETGEIRATIDTSAFSGEISKSLLVLTNDAERERLKLTVKAVVDPA